MKKYKLIPLICAVAITLSGCVEFKGIELDLNKFKTSDNYFCYDGLSWDASIAAVKKVLPIDLGDPYTGTVNPKTPFSFEHAIYQPDVNARLFKKEGTIRFEFRDELLSDVLFTYKDKPKEIQEFSDEVLAELERIYSNKFTRTDHATDGALRVTYEWELPYGTDRTSRLQLIVYSRADIPRSVAIHMHCPNPKYYMEVK